MKIVSTVPSQTELLHALGLEEEVVGITKFCVFPPEWQQSKTIVGGTKNLRTEAIKALKPDWILSNKEENIKEQIEAFSELSSIYTSDVTDLDSAIEMILAVGAITDRPIRAEEMVHTIQNNFSNMRRDQRRRVLYLIWKNPYMSVGSDTFIHDMIERCQWENVTRKMHRYPTLELSDIRSLNPSDIFLSSEPYPFKERDVEELSRVFPDTRIILVDGTYFSWYGSRLLHSPGYFTHIMNMLQT